MSANDISMYRIYKELAREHFQLTGQFKSERTKHGTRTAYNKYGCRCDECMAFYQTVIKPQVDECTNSYLTRLKEHFHKTGQFLYPSIQHGSAAAYVSGCRCILCKESESSKHRRYRLRRKQQEGQLCEV